MTEVVSRTLAWSLLLLSPLLAQTSAGQAGQELRKRLAEAPLDDSLAERLNLSCRLGDAEVGSLTLRTTLVQLVDGTPVYRLSDRLRLDLPDMGTLSLNLEADVLADLSVVSLVLQSEEPRGRGKVSRRRISLRREESRWVREVVRGAAAPEQTVLEDLEAQALVLTPPLGIGERLTRLARPQLGMRLKLAAYDLESAQPTSWRLSIDERRPTPTETGLRDLLVARRREGPAQLELLLSPDTGEPWLVGSGSRLRWVDRSLLADESPPESPAEVVIAFLRASADGDLEALRELLDLDVLYRQAGGDHNDGPLREGFQTELLKRLSDGSAPFALQAAQSEDLTWREGEGARMLVHPRSDPELVFALERRGGSYRIVELPRRRQD